MKKIWFFLEGDSEEIFISNLIRNKFHSDFYLEKDLVKFVNEFPKGVHFNAIYIANCHSVDKIPHHINERYYLVEKSRASHIFIVCDVEKLKCYSKRKEHIEKILDASIDRSLIRYAFFNPMIEKAYWECPDIIKRIIQLEYKKKYKSSKPPNIVKPVSIVCNKNGLKKWFKTYKVKYRETIFAGEFFPRVDYGDCKNDVLIRLCELLESI